MSDLLKRLAASAGKGSMFSDLGFVARLVITALQVFQGVVLSPECPKEISLFKQGAGGDEAGADTHVRPVA